MGAAVRLAIWVGGRAFAAGLTRSAIVAEGRVDKDLCAFGESEVGSGWGAGQLGLARRVVQVERCDRTQRKRAKRP